MPAKPTRKSKKHVAASHQHDVAAVRELVNTLISKLTPHITGTPAVPLAEETDLWGSKENAVSLLVKLTGLLLKLIPLEQSLLEQRKPRSNVSRRRYPIPLEEEDREIIRRFAETLSPE